MTRFIDAICTANIVTVSGVPILDAVILSEGIGPSTGILIVSEDKPYYIAKTSGDLSSTIDLITNTLTQLSATISAIIAALTIDKAAFSAGIASTVANIVTLNVQIAALKAALK